MKPVTLKLTQAIKVANQQVLELTINPPTGTDIISIGAAPFQIEDMGAGRSKTHMDLALTGQYLVRLASIPPSSVAQMNGFDLIQACGVISGFFAPPEDSRKSEADTSNSEGSSAEG